MRRGAARTFTNICEERPRRSEALVKGRISIPAITGRNLDMGEALRIRNCDQLQRRSTRASRDVSLVLVKPFERCRGPSPAQGLRALGRPPRIASAPRGGGSRSRAAREVVDLRDDATRQHRGRDDHHDGARGRQMGRDHRQRSSRDSVSLGASANRLSQRSTVVRGGPVGLESRDRPQPVHPDIVEQSAASKYRIIESLALRPTSGVWRTRHSPLQRWCIQS